MFTARFNSPCASCHALIRVGMVVVVLEPGVFAHADCHQQGEVSNPGGKPNHIGKVACDAFGNVISMFGAVGWEEVQQLVRAERTVAGNVFPLARPAMNVNVPMVERAEAMVASISHMGDYVAVDHSGEWWDGVDDDDVWRDGW